ncbi:MAG: hypothetical protein MRY64_12540 [Hyphomonadaceae bacterium]|nr:hypothetical protein [Hyphomonadaceae bacterium]
MKRTHVEFDAAPKSALVSPDQPVNAVEARAVYSQPSKTSVPVAKPRLLARRNARFARRATH